MMNNIKEAMRKKILILMTKITNTNMKNNSKIMKDHSNREERTILSTLLKDIASHINLVEKKKQKKHIIKKNSKGNSIKKFKTLRKIISKKNTKETNIKEAITIKTSIEEKNSNRISKMRNHIPIRAGARISITKETIIIMMREKEITRESRILSNYFIVNICPSKS